MRNYHSSLVIAIAASMFALSCTREQPEEPETLFPDQFVATIEDGDSQEDTKLALSSDYKSVTWQIGNYIYFLADDGTDKEIGSAYVSSIDQNGKRAIFKADISGTPKFAYTSSNRCRGVSGQTILAIANSVQGGTFNEASVMAAKVAPGSNSLSFKNLLGIIEFKVTDSQVTKAVLSGTGIGGYVRVTFGSNNTILLISKTERVDPNYNTITIDNIGTGTYYAAVRPGTYAAGSLTLTYYNANGGVVSSSVLNKDLTITRRDIIGWGDAGDHNNNLNSLPTGKSFNNYLATVAGSKENIKKIVFTTQSDYVYTTDKRIANDIYMRYDSSTQTVTVSTPDSAMDANPDCSDMFKDLTNLQTIEGLYHLDMYSVTSMSKMFYNCQSLQSLDFSSVLIPNIADLTSMFEFCYGMNELFIGQNFIIREACASKVTRMLNGCPAIVYFRGKSSLESFYKYLVTPGDYSVSSSWVIDMGNAGWWSARNFNARKISEYGKYYQWYGIYGYWLNGTSDGHVFDASTYRAPADSYSPWTVEHGFRVPLAGDFEALAAASNITSATVDGVSGYKYTHKTSGNWIFFPSAGYINGSTRYSGCQYWTGNNEGNTSFETSFYPSTGNFNKSGTRVYYGLPVRLIADYGIVLATSVSLNSSTLKLPKGASATITATVAPANATDRTITWTSSNTSVATVSNGKVTAVGAGTATITAMNNRSDKKATCTVTVYGPKPTGLKLMYGFGTQTEVPGGSVSIEEAGDGSVFSRVDAVVTPADADYVMYWTVSSSSNLKPYSSDYKFGSSSSSGSNPLLFYTATDGRNAAVTLTCTVQSKDGSTTLTKNFYILASVSDRQCIYFNLGSTSSFTPHSTTGFGSSTAPSSYQGLYSSSKYTGYNCYAHFSAPVREIPTNAFNGISSIKSVKFPSTLTTIGSSAFFECSNLSKIEFNEGLVRIGFAAFWAKASSDTGPSEFSLPSTLKEIGDRAFKDVRKATIIIPASVTAMEGDPFYDSGSLKTVRMDGTTPPTLTSNIFGLCSNLTTISIPYSAYNAYTTALYWRTLKDKFVTR